MKNVLIANIGRIGSVLVSLVVTGCFVAEYTGHSTNSTDRCCANGDIHEHHHDEEKETVTVYTTTFELFAEYPLLVAGTPHPFLFHLTHVNSGLPIGNATVVCTIHSEDNHKVGEAIAHFQKSGIYEATLTFPTAGRHSITLAITSDTDGGDILLENLDVHNVDELHSHHHTHETEKGELIFLSKEQQWVVPVITAEVHRRELFESFRIPAVVAAAPESRVLVTTPIAGQITASSDLYPRIGDPVVAGQPLAEIIPTLWSAEVLALQGNQQGLQNLKTDLITRYTQASAEALRARAQVAQHKSALERAKRLFEVQAGARREVEAAESALAEAQATLNAAEQVQAQTRKALEEARDDMNLPSLSAVPITASLTGQIVRIFTAMGAQVSGGDTLFEIINTDYVLVEARIHETLAARIAWPPEAWYEFHTPSKTLHPIVPPKEAISPVLLPLLDETTKSVPLIIPAENRERHLRVGSSLTLWVKGVSNADALAIPSSAVLDEYGIPTVYVVRTGETFEKRSIRIGIRNGTHVEVLGGLNRGERVVAQGAYAVRLAGLAAAELGSAHVH